MNVNPISALIRQCLKTSRLGEETDRCTMGIAWNVVATAQPGEFFRAKQLLERFGAVERTDFYNVLVLQTVDPEAFLSAYAERMNEDARLAQCFSKVTPSMRMFDFSDVEDFEGKVRKEVFSFVSDLEGKSFHVRINRRGLKGEISSQKEEQSLDYLLLQELENRGAPGRIDFDDPDAIIDVETVGGRAGVSLWTREDLRQFRFLKVD